MEWFLLLGPSTNMDPSLTQENYVGPVYGGNPEEETVKRPLKGDNLEAQC